MSLRRTLFVGLSLLALVACPKLATGQAINIDSGNTDDCAIFMPGGATFTFYVEIVLGGAVNGYQGMTFRIEGMPASVFATVTIPDFVGIPCDPGGCNPFGPEGMSLAWQSCISDATRRVVRIDGFAPSPVPPDTFLRVLGVTTPAPRCPTLYLCDAPVFTGVCVAGGMAIINPSTGACSLAIEQESWAGVKELFRD